MAFDFEKMDVYKLSLKAIDGCLEIIDKMPRGNSNLADQLRRAISSVSLNISEGSGEFKPREKARFYRIALRSVSESGSILQIGYRLKIIDDSRYRDAYSLLTLIAKMLTKLAIAMDQRDTSITRYRNVRTGKGMGIKDRDQSHNRFKSP